MEKKNTILDVNGPRLVTSVRQWCLIPFSYPREFKATPKPQIRLGKIATDKQGLERQPTGHLE